MSNSLTTQPSVRRRIITGNHPNKEVIIIREYVNLYKRKSDNYDFSKV